MEKFKAVEKAMKTKAYSKEGLSAAAKLDPREQAKSDAGDFLGSMVDELEQQIEALEAESESIQATMKKGKGHAAKAERIAEIERIIERHKWHQSKLELIRRSLENGGVEADQVNDLGENIKYYVSDGMNDDFMEDETMYDDLNLQDEEDQYGMNVDNDRGSSQDTQSIQDDATPEVEAKPSAPAGKQRTAVDAVAGSAVRRPSTQLKSPLPTLATVHSTPLPTLSNGAPVNTGMKPAAAPTRLAGEGLKYASAAAAAANSVGIAPLPPPPSAAPSIGGAALPTAQARASAANSPSVVSVQPVPQEKGSSASPAPASGPATAAPSHKASAKGKGVVAQAAATAAAVEAAKGLDEPPGVLSNGGANARLYSGAADKRRGQWHQADRGGRGRGGVDLPPPCVVARLDRVIRGHKNAACADECARDTPHAGRVRGEQAWHFGCRTTTQLPARCQVPFTHAIPARAAVHI
jgi:CCR4-NOT transcription complex subunit 3